MFRHQNHDHRRHRISSLAAADEREQLGAGSPRSSGECRTVHDDSHRIAWDVRLMPRTVRGRVRSGDVALAATVSCGSSFSGTDPLSGEFGVG